MRDRLTWHALWIVEKYITGEPAPYEVSKFEGNVALNAGINLLFDLMVGDDANHFDNSNAEIGVGDDDAAENATQTGLQAAVNKLYKGMEAGYPASGASQRVDFKSSFDDSEAEYAWEEFCVRNKDGGTCLNRKVEDLGTKLAGQTWVVRVRILLS